MTQVSGDGQQWGVHSRPPRRPGRGITIEEESTGLTGQGTQLPSVPQQEVTLPRLSGSSTPAPHLFSGWLPLTSCVRDFGREAGSREAENASLSVCPCVTSNHHRKEILLCGKSLVAPQCPPGRNWYRGRRAPPCLLMAGWQLLCLLPGTLA